MASGRWQIVASIDDGVDYGLPDFKTAVEGEGTADNDIDFGGQDNDHGEEREEERRRQESLLYQRRQNLHLLWIQMFCVRLH